MTTLHTFTSDVAFTPTVKAIQTRKGSRHAYARMEQGGSWASAITPEIKAFIEGTISMYMATASSTGQPYIQHRGGPAGFLKVLDPHTIAFVDFTGNRQFISSGNLQDNPQTHLFLMDYANRQRIKIWGTARVIEGDLALTEKLMPADYKAQAEQIIVFSVTAWDANCTKHIPVRYEAADVKRALDKRDAKITQLQAEVARLRALAAQA